MEAVVAVIIGVLVACSIYLLLRARTFPVVLGLILLGYAVNLLLFASGRLKAGSAGLVVAGVEELPDPLPQALVLTAVVIGFGMTAFVVLLALRSHGDLDTDHVDGDDER